MQRLLKDCPRHKAKNDVIEIKDSAILNKQGEKVVACHRCGASKNKGKKCLFDSTI